MNRDWYGGPLAAFSEVLAMLATLGILAFAVHVWGVAQGLNP